MKLVITTTGEGLDAPMDRRFGRAAAFLVYDLEAETYAVIGNDQNLQAAQGAGIQACVQRCSGDKHRLHADRDH